MPGLDALELRRRAKEPGRNRVVADGAPALDLGAPGPRANRVAPSPVSRARLPDAGV
jgi:hypothetical protein